MRVGFAIVTVWLAAGCVGSDSIVCADGTICPRDRQCVLISDAYHCVSDEQLAACEDKVDFAACAGGTCFDGVCLAPSCGDERISPIEVCDDGNTAPGDGCSADCRSDETCGNGVINLFVGEDCDDGEAGRGLSHDGCSSTCLVERPEWRTLLDYDELFATTQASAVAYDLARGRVVALASSGGQFHTLELESGVWFDVSPQVGPTERAGLALAYDASRQRVVMFGGLGFRDTWEWDGATWTLLQPAVAPPSRTGHVMAYDPIGRRIVVFGGYRTLVGTLSSELSDTWTWDGTTWKQLSGQGPSARGDAAMAFDPARGVFVLYGGNINDNALADTWELVGETWSDRTPANPQPRRQHTMAFDPISRRVLAYGGREDGPAFDTTSAWDGTTWTPVASDVTDPGRTKLVTLVHEQRVLLINALGMYEWSGSGWTNIFTSKQGGFRRGRAAAAVDIAGRRMLVFGGTNPVVLTNTTDVWRGMWSTYTGGAPPARGSAAMAYDVARGEFVLFGGINTTGLLDDTWVFDGTWIERTPTVSPPPRANTTLVYDAAREEVVLFGGTGATQLADTWTWNGTAWSEVTGPGPLARSDHAATYDPIREEVVMFGGFAAANQPPLGDTWTWNGTVWTMRADNGPSARISMGLAWDSARQRTTLFGGNTTINSFSNFGDAWEWDGIAWTQLTTTAIAARSGHLLVPALDGAGVIRFGLDNPTGRDDLAQLRWTTRNRDEACVRADFDGDGLGEGMCDGDPDCWRICTPLCPPGTSCQASTIGCGDGTCSPERETCLSCPDDCGGCPMTCGDLKCSPGETSCATDCP